MKIFTGIIRRLEYHAYQWDVKARNKREAKKKMLCGDGRLLGSWFVERSKLNNGNGVIQFIKEVTRRNE